MFVLAALLLLSAVSMTTADEISDSLKLPPLKEQIYIFEVTSEADAADIKASFDNDSMKIRHSFKVIGEPRYYFVVIGNNDTNALRALKLPAGSDVTQYPVEHTSEFFKMFGVSHTWDENDTMGCLPDTGLQAKIFQFKVPANLKAEDFKLIMHKMATQYGDAHASVKSVSYAVITAYPPKIFFFDKFEENTLQNVILMGLDAAEGPANFLFSVERIVKI